jgi:hypothetical protein
MKLSWVVSMEIVIAETGKIRGKALSIYYLDTFV